ncbi:MAG: histidine phosphatase family protein [Firmicutes bacterium]|nr:histidine phosphatase family protein [Bacillota bacterium]
MVIYLMRHGETEWNRIGKLQGQSDIPLNESGIRLAEETAEGLRNIHFNAAFSSPLQRALVTAKIVIGSRPVAIETDDRLKEIHFGAYEGKSFGAGQPESVHPLARPESYVPVGGGESIGEAKARAEAFLKDRLLPLERKFNEGSSGGGDPAGGNVLVVAHGAINRCILNSIAGISDRDFWKISLPNCAVSILSLERGKFKILEESRVYGGS